MQEFIVWVSGASLVCTAVLSTHALRQSWGLAPIYACLGFIASTMMWLFTAGARIEFADITVLWGSSFLTGLLLGAFVLYVFDGTQAARLAIATAFLAIFAHYTLGIGLNWQISQGLSDIQTPWVVGPTRLYIGTAISTIFDTLVMIMLWEALGRWRSSGSLLWSVFTTLLGTLALDALLFPLIALGHSPYALPQMQGALIERMLLLLWLSPLVAVYLRWQQKLYGHDLGRGKVLSILSLSALSERRLSRAEAEIRNRMTTEEELRRDQTILQTVLDNCHAIVFLKNPHGQYLLVNSFFEDALGVTRDQVVGKTDFELRSQPVAKRMFNIDQRVMEVGEAAQYEEEVPRSGGEPRTYVTNKVPLFDADGKVYGLCGFSTDITERKASEKASLENQRRLQLAVDAAAAGTFVWNCQTGLLEWDERSLEIFGLNSESFKETFLDWIRHVHPDDQDEFTLTLQEHLSDASRWEHEYRILRSDGATRTVAAAGYFTVGRDGEPETLIGLHLDITEQRLAQQALQNAKLAAEDANRAKSDFLATMSHEIRTPMNAVLGMAHLVARTPLNPKQADYVNKIETSAKALLRIINDILDFSKIEAGKLRFERIDFLLDEVLDNLSHTLSIRKVDKKDLDITFHVDPNVPRYLRGDPLRLGQVLTNLGANAIKFTPKGQITISVRCLEAPPLPSTAESEQDPSSLSSHSAHTTLEFSVADTGIGMSTEEMTRLFRPFSQADSSTTRKYGGTGLGLSISKKIVEMMGGTIAVRSRTGEGSCFYFSARFELRRSPSRTDELPTKDSSDISFCGEQILLVEDNEINQQVARELLEQAGLKVTIAGHGQQAIDFLKTTPFALILMDLQMPVMDGLTATRQIRQQKLADGIPIIAMTASAMTGDRDDCFAAGMNDYVSKPIDPFELTTTLHRHLKSRHQAMPQASPQQSVTPNLDLQNIASLNASKGLLRVAGNTSLYRKLLLQFDQGQRHAVFEVRNALEHSDSTLALQILHNLKGVAANLSADRIANLAAEAEQALQEPRSKDIQSILDKLDHEVDRLCQDVSKLEDISKEKPSEQNSLDLQTLFGEINAIESFLETDIAQALSLSENLLQRSAGQEFSPSLTKLQAALESFDVDEAQKVIDNIRSCFSCP